jgi:hypothetical protein
MDDSFLKSFIIIPETGFEMRFFATFLKLVNIFVLLSGKVDNALNCRLHVKLKFLTMQPSLLSCSGDALSIISIFQTTYEYF